MTTKECPSPRANAENRANRSTLALMTDSTKFSDSLHFAAISENPADPRAFIAEHAAGAAYWADLAREAAIICDDVLLAYATRKAAACARAFVGAVKEMLLPNKAGGQ